MTAFAVTKRSISARLVVTPAGSYTVKPSTPVATADAATQPHGRPRYVHSREILFVRAADCSARARLIRCLSP
jgi:hypothetical protein